MGFQDRSDKERQAFWKWARSVLENGDAAQRKALGYALWCEFFEDPQTIDEAWQNLIEPLPNDQALHTILIHSGPVPWEKKWSLFLDLRGRTEMHYYIFRSILHSQFDVYGRLDQREALQILERLQISPETKYLSKLRSKLQEGVAYK